MIASILENNVARIALFEHNNEENRARFATELKDLLPEGCEVKIDGENNPSDVINSHRLIGSVFFEGRETMFELKSRGITINV